MAHDTTAVGQSPYPRADTAIGVKTKLAVAWAAVVACYIWGDLVGLMQPGQLTAMLAMRTPLGPVTPDLLLAFAIFMSIPWLMVFLSALAPRPISRWANVVLGAIFTVVILTSLPGPWGFYLELGVVEALLTATATWLAWTWPRPVRP
jgi:hypothetical protein